MGIAVAFLLVTLITCIVLLANHYLCFFSFWCKKTEFENVDGNKLLCYFGNVKEKECICHDGYEGDQCDVPINSENENTENENSADEIDPTCVYGTKKDDGTCECDDNHLGPSCRIFKYGVAELCPDDHLWTGQWCIGPDGGCPCPDAYCKQFVDDETRASFLETVDDLDNLDEWGQLIVNSHLIENQYVFRTFNITLCKMQ